MVGMHKAVGQRARRVVTKRGVNKGKFETLVSYRNVFLHTHEIFSQSVRTWLLLEVERRVSITARNAAIFGKKMSYDS